MSNINQKLKLGILWNVSGTILSKVFVMAASILTARLLGAEGNGEFGMINNTVGMFSTFAALGLGTTATRFVAEFKNNQKRRCGNIIALSTSLAFLASLVLSLFIWIFSGWLAEYTLNNSELSFGLRLSVIMLIFNTINTVQISILSGFEDFKSVASVSVIQGIVSFPVFMLTTVSYGVDGLVVGYGIVGIISFVISRAIINKNCKRNNIEIHYNTCLEEYKILFKFSLPAMLMNIVVIPITWLGNTIIVNQPSGYSDLGIFNAANQWKTAITLLPTAIGNVILPFIVSSENEKIEDLNMMISWIIVSFLSTGVILFSDLIAIFYGSSYPADILSSNISLICLVCCILSFKEGISRNLIKHNYMWFSFMSNGLWGITYIACVFFLKEYGTFAISMSYLVSYSVTTIVFIPFYISRNIVDKKYIYNKRILLMWLALILETCVTMTIKNIILKVVVCLMSLIMIYVVSDYFFDCKKIGQKLINKVVKK